jgi:hypothetical protein
MRRRHLTVAFALVLVLAACDSVTMNSATSSSLESGLVSSTDTTQTTAATPADDAERSKGLFVLDYDIEPIRAVSPNEVGPVRGACLQHRGIDVTIGSDGSSLYFQGIPQEQQERLQEEQAICKALYPLDDAYSGPLNEEELGRLYDFYVGSLVPCLEAEGYSGFEPPSLDTYVESYGTESEWMPYTDIIHLVDAMSEGKRQALFGNCPQAPSSEYLFGG